MASYVTYQCSICRRVKDSLKDDTRAAPNQCNITKGCSGRLFKIGVSSTASTVAPRADLTDWYPRGHTPSITAEEVTPPPISLSCSSTGVLTLAIYQSDAEAMSANRTTVFVKLTQRRSEDIAYQQYLFRYNTPTTLISGKDTTGKNLRFDQVMIDEGRVFVRVNGVARFPGSTGDEIVFTPNTVSFNSEVAAQSTIDITIYTEKDTIEKTIAFNANRTFVVNTNSGSWGNVRYVEEFGNNGALKPNKWWLYSCTSHGGIAPSARLRFEEIYEANGTTIAIPETQFDRLRFLIASEPLQNADRYLNFYVSEIGRAHV